MNIHISCHLNNSLLYIEDPLHFSASVTIKILEPRPFSLCMQSCSKYGFNLGEMDVCRAPVLCFCNRLVPDWEMHRQGSRTCGAVPLLKVSYCMLAHDICRSATNAEGHFIKSHARSPN